MKLFILILCSISAFKTHCFELMAYEAKYDINRGGKKTGEQITRLTQLAPNLWRIEDQITGTNGMASFIGFSRSETTDFSTSKNRYFATKHRMQQKAAFSKKNYQFIWKDDKKLYEIDDNNKKVVLSPVNKNIVSAQLMSLILADAACSQKSEMDLTVLKNKQPKDYLFKINTKDSLNAERVYDRQSKKSTQIWFDKNRLCLPIKQIHKENDEPTIETSLIDFKWL